ncbi:MAG: endonuclease [Paludibacteraceae bacterium]|nr:endonuclease [Paludibacteraceae bacterium]
MRKIIPFVLLTIATFLYAEPIPPGYYAAIDGKADSVLKSTLHEIVKGGERWKYGYDAHTTNKQGEWKIGDPKPCTWMGFNSTDVRSDGTVWDMYSNTKRYFPIKCGSAAGLDIEHSVPKSWWGASTKESEYNKDAAYCDLYHLCPADRIANNNKSDIPPGILADSSKVNNGLFFKGMDTTWGKLAFCVCDEYKGDFAREYFYIATAYQDKQWVSDYKAYVSNVSYKTFSPYLVQVLLNWHRIDPVSEKEINRLNAISSIQHNRNPYIEYPELVEYIWGNKQGQTVSLANLICTTSPDYQIPISATNPTAYEANNITTTGFTARWSNTGSESYSLDVFTRETTGHNDTLIAMWGFKSSVLDTIPQLSWLNTNGTKSTYGNMDGSYATCMSTISALKQLRITDFGKAPSDTYLAVKCCIFKSDDSADLIVKGNNGAIIATQPLALDEQTYIYPIPKGTDTISLWQKEVGKSGNYHRISLQQVFLYTGDEQTIETSLSGYPQEVTGTSASVVCDLPKDAIVYYRVTPKNLRPTNTIRVVGTGDIPSQIPALHKTPAAPIKEVHKGLVVIRRNNRVYTLLGQPKK